MRQTEFTQGDMARFQAMTTHVPETACLIWCGAIDSWGYGRFAWRGKARKSNRVAYTIAKGDIPDGLSVLHTCDTPACVNPDHLFLGTHKENMEDRDAKGRVRSGERSGKARWPDATVKAIVEADGTQEEIAARFGCGHSIVGYYKAGGGRAAQFVRRG